MEINVDVFKPSGTWYSRLIVVIPENLNRHDLMDFIADHFYDTDKYQMIMTNREMQSTEKASDYVSYPEAYNLENF